MTTNADEFETLRDEFQNAVESFQRLWIEGRVKDDCQKQVNDLMTFFSELDEAYEELKEEPSAASKDLFRSSAEEFTDYVDEMDECLFVDFIEEQIDLELNTPEAVLFFERFRDKLDEEWDDVCSITNQIAETVRHIVDIGIALDAEKRSRKRRKRSVRRRE